MSKKVKLAILRARHDTSTPVISDKACINLLMTSPARRSVLNYWSDNTNGYLDFLDSALFPWVDISMSASDLSRGTQVKKAYEATKTLNDNKDLEGFDGFAVISYPGQMTVPNPKAGQPGQPSTIVVNFDGGAGPVAHGKPACALPVMTSDHTFMCHEVGHVLGFKHSYGVWNNGIDWDGIPPWDEGQVYGDPYDIMSSATFGSRFLDPKKSKYFGSPQFAVSSEPGWPIQPKINMGPAPARAHVHLWDPLAIPSSRIVHMQRPTGGSTRRLRLYAASSTIGSPILVVIHPEGEDDQGRGRCYVEFRDTKGWDAGMDVSGNDLARQAVVVHTLADASSDGVRCWYRGRILVPVEIDSDLKVAGTPLVVRVTDDDVSAGYVDIEISTTSVRGVDLDITVNDEVIAMIDTHEMGTPCGDTLVWGTAITTSLYFYRAITYGYGGEGLPDALPTVISWKVGGLSIPPGTGSLNVPASGGEFTVEYSLDPVTQELSLSSRGGEKYSAPVEVRVTEPGGGNPTTVVSSFDPLGYYNGFRPGDLAKLEACMNKYLRFVRLRPRDILVPPGPDPYRQQWRDRINQSRLQEVVRLISESHPSEAIALGALVVMRYGTDTRQPMTRLRPDVRRGVTTIAAIAVVGLTLALLVNILRNRPTSMGASVS